MAEIRQIFIALLVFSGVALSLTTFYGDMINPTYLAAYGYNDAQITGILGSNTNISRLSVISNVTLKATKLKESVEEVNPTGLTVTDVAWGYINAAMNAVTLPLTALSLFQNMIEDASSLLGLPAYITSIIIGILVIIVLFEIISSFMKWRS